MVRLSFNGKGFVWKRLGEIIYFVYCDYIFIGVFGWIINDLCEELLFLCIFREYDYCFYI